MRISVVRTLAPCVSLGFVSGVGSHAPIEEPTWSEWFYGANTEVNHVANRTVLPRVCQNASRAPHFIAGHTLTSVVTHTADRAGIGQTVHPTSGEAYTTGDVSRTQIGAS
jgi:hypothetical protein